VADDLAIVCKSWRGDLARAKRLVESLAPHNPEGLPVWLIVSRADEPLFREALAGHAVHIGLDEDVVARQPDAERLKLLERYAATPGYRMQQVVKSEAWRLIGCANYLCADSDTVFLRPVRRSDLLAPAGHVYTLLHQSRELLALAHARGHSSVATHFHAESERLQKLFGREGPHYDFGPSPLIWSAAVWNDLHAKFLAPRGWSLWDAIDAVPTEIRWYGEALLAYRSIPLDPIEPLFRVYHHEWQWLMLQRLGETPETLAREFLGAVYQSNWEYELDADGARSFGSRLARRLKRFRRRLQAWA
jgi:hypothetical protein